MLVGFPVFATRTKRTMCNQKEPDMTNENHKFSRAAKTVVSFLVGLNVFAGMIVASFIYTCGMKFMDGPQGGSSEAPLMMVFMLLSVYCPFTVVWGLLREGYDFSPGFYLAGIFPLAFILLAAVAGWSMEVVQWGSSSIQLVDISNWSAILAACLSLLLAGHACLQKRIEGSIWS